MLICRICDYCYSSLDFFATVPAQLAGGLWLLCAFMLLLLELTTPGLFLFISFAAGCIFGALTAFAGYSIMIQCVSSLIGLSISFFFLRRWSKKTTTMTLKTNIDALIGQKALVTKAIHIERGGYVKVRGEEWPAFIENSTTELHTHSYVIIVAVRGNKLVVIPIA